MKKEVKSAVDFLSNILKTSKNVTDQQVQHFNDNLQHLLRLKYENHWFPDKPCKGSGFRCIRINHNMDPLIRQAGHCCSIDENSLKNYFPKELTMWVDPHDVSYRIGENGSIGILFETNSNMVSNSHQTSQNDNEIEQTNRMIPYTTCKEEFLNVSRDKLSLKHLNLAAYISS